MATTEVVGRDDELGTIQAFLAEVVRGPTALVLSGEAGIGKTILWEAGADEARRRYSRVLSHRSAEAEVSLAFAGLSDLLEPVLDEVASELPPLRRQALEVALLRAAPGAEHPDPRAIGLAFLDVLKLLAERGPVLVALDDLQWLDSSSALVVPLALRRLQEERIGVLATCRTGPEIELPFELRRSFPEERLRQLSLAPLSLAALHHLLRERLALELARPELARVRETSGGNPFFALELGRELVRTSTRVEAGQALPVPDSLRELLGGRLARLPAQTSDVLLYAAGLARPTVDLIADAYGDSETVLTALDLAVRNGVLDIDDSRVRFAHPMLGSICYEQAPLWRRRAVHLALAGAVTDLEEHARHLALATQGPDPVVASGLDAAADQAAARGASAAAAELCELAAERTAADPRLARTRRLRAASLHRLAGDNERAAAMLEQLLTEVPSGLERADVLFALTMTLRAGSPTLIRFLDEALSEAARDDARAARILAFRTGMHLFGNDVRAALADARAALEKAERAGDPALIAQAISRVGTAEIYAAEITPGLLERGTEIERRLGLALEYVNSPRYGLNRLVMCLGEIERPRTDLADLQAEAVARGDESTRVMVIWTLSMLEWLAGRWQQALEHAAEAHGLAEQTQHGHARAWVGRVRGLVETDLGLVEPARASIEEGLAFTRANSIEFHTIAGLGVLGRLEFLLGNLEAAADYLRDLPGRLLAGGMNEPTVPVWADALEVLIAVRELEEARVYLNRYEAHAAQFGSPWAMAAAARCRGLLGAAEDDPTAAFEAFERALAQLDAHPYPLERARTLLCLGMARRQAGRKTPAREALEEAISIFEELGARLWAEKARGELGRISGRKAAPDELTETELRVAALAARGQTNKEIAAELFMGMSTVEMHLSRVYRKLGVRRAGLAARLATVDEPAEV